MTTTTLMKAICRHTTGVIVHAVEGGYRSHCLTCGKVGPVCKSPRATREALSYQITLNRSEAGDIQSLEE